ncbi:septal ring lytic transglycosylase RlpA family protein [Sphingopyxis sp.]|uniref:septal ring lytic transglycosylase RlpA family protein n=1 Tax=Sphingopyxis sp. TaxID=1908224 RepID=UPI0039C8EFAC
MYGETIKGTPDQFAGQSTTNGEKMDPNAMTAASVSLRDGAGNLPRTPLIGMGTTLVVSLNSDPSKSVVVRINDTSPLRPSRILDLIPAAMKPLAGKAYNEVAANAYDCK